MSSTRRSRTGLLVLALCGPAAFPLHSIAQAPAAPHVVSIATLAPAGSTWMRVFESWGREVRRRSNRTLQLRFYPNGVQGDEAETVRKVRAGRIDATAVTAVGLAQIHRPTVAFQLPGLFADNAALDRARNALRGELDAAYTQAGFELLGWGDAGTDHLFSVRELRTPAQFARMRTFVWRDDPVLPALVAETRANGVLLQLPEVLTSLQTGTVDTLVASPIAVASLQWAPHLSHMTDLAYGIEVGALVMGHAQYESLGAADQTILRETAAQFCGLLVHNVRRDDDGAVPLMRERGLTVDTLTAAERAEWTAVFARTRARLAGALGDAGWIARLERAGRP